MVLVGIQLFVAGLYPGAGICARAVVSTPNYHFGASPHCRVSDSGSGRIGQVLVDVQLSVAGL